MTVKVRTTLAMEWAKLEREVRIFDGTEDEMSANELRLARSMFYGGAFALFHLIDRCNSADAFVSLMERIKQELEEFRIQNAEDVELIEELERNGHGKINRRNRAERAG